MSRRFALFAILILSASAAEDPGITFDPYKHVIWIPVRINGGPPLTFGFDSAAARSAIDWDRAEEMKLQFTDLGERLNRGSGDGATRAGRTGPVRVEIPGARLDLPALGVVPLRGVSESYGRRMDGLIGAELLSRYVVELDWEARRMAFHEPADYHYSGKGSAVPLIIAGGAPYVRLEVSVPGAEPVEGIFLVDCPHPGTIIINRPFLEEHGLLEAAQKKLRRLVPHYAEGVGGRSAILYGRIAGLKIGPFTLGEPVVGFSQAHAGALAQSEFAGILGAEILRRFRVVMDFSRERMILEPKAILADPFRFDASGMRLRSAGADLSECEVSSVVQDSPASRAGLRSGDRLIEVGGKPAAALGLGAILETLKRDGETVALKVRRGEETLNVPLPLRKLL